MDWSRKHTLIAGLALIALTNAIALGGVAWNRSGDPDSTLRLTQRELVRPYTLRFQRGAGGLELALRWRVPVSGPDASPNRYGTPAWLDREKLASLGFDVSPPAGERARGNAYSRLLPREALVVLEQDGPAYRAVLERARERAAKTAAAGAEPGTDPKRHMAAQSAAKSAAEALKREETQGSRLFAVDAGLDAHALRAKYPDRARYAIVNGKIRAWYLSGRDGKGRWRGHVEGLDNDRINVPRKFHAALESARVVSAWEYASQGAAPFELVVAFGKRFEPWVLAASVGRGAEQQKQEGGRRTGVVD